MSDLDPAAAGPHSRAAVFGRAVAVALAVVGIDQLAKQIAIHAVEPGHPFEIMFGIEVANVRNPGIAFGFLSESDGAILAITAGAIAAMVAYLAMHYARPGLWLAVGLLAGGAIANLTDRLRVGEVIDFIDFPLWPAFNLADVAIVLGAVGLALTLMGPDEQRA
ncbi:MAG: signal peptidase II [Solirubrobacterales bacterium]